MKITLVITGGIAAYKSLILIRRLREAGLTVVPVMTRGAQEFITPLSVASLAEHEVYSDLFSLKDETQMGHIRLMRDCDLVLVAPASADFLAKMAHGLADDLASTALLASDKPVVVAPSMNTQMWAHAATQANVDTLAGRGIEFWGPAEGDLACGDMGSGRMLEPEELAALVLDRLQGARKLAGKRVLVTAGPTQEAIDPVRYISNHSSGKQGYAIAEAFAAQGAQVTLVTGPTQLPTPSGVQRVEVLSAQQMLDAVRANNAPAPVDIAIFAAAVADWQMAQPSDQKLKKQPGQESLSLDLAKTPDILAHIGTSADQRPKLVIGFAAETQDLVANAQRKLASKGADLILANDVSEGTDTFGGENNQVTAVTTQGHKEWPRGSKQQVAQQLVDWCADRLGDTTS